MKTLECPREADVIAAVQSRRWPDRSDAELREHVASCAICQDVAEVAAAFGIERETAWEHAPVPSSAHVWWRAQIRARMEAERTAMRPITVVQSISALLAVGLFLVVIAVAWTALSATNTPSAWSDPLSFLRAMAGSGTSVVQFLAAGTVQTLLVLGLVAAGLVLMPVAVYLALSE